MNSTGGRPFLQAKQRESIARKEENLDFPLHLHNAVELVLMLSGRTTVLYEGRRLPVSGGELFLAFPDRIHGYEDSRGSESIVFIIPLHPYLSEFREILERKLPVDPVLHAGEWEHTQVRQLLEMAEREWMQAGSKVTHGYAMLIMAKLLPLLKLQDAPSGSINALQAVLLYLNRHYTQPLTRQSIAAAVGYHESYISHLFSEAMHTTLTDYINALRVEDAVYLLSGTDLTSGQIAEELGFGCQRSFNRVFFRHMHMTPSACRAAARAGKMRSDGVDRGNRLLFG